MAKRQPFTSNGRGEKCTYCKRTLESVKSRSRVAATRDHVVPKHMGGGYRVWCCRHCNSLKGGLPLEAWETFMQRYPEWWKQQEFRHSMGNRVRSECLGPSPLTARTDVAEVTRDDHEGNLVLGIPKAAGAGCEAS